MDLLLHRSWCLCYLHNGRSFSFSFLFLLNCSFLLQFCVVDWITRILCCRWFTVKIGVAFFYKRWFFSLLAHLLCAFLFMRMSIKVFPFILIIDHPILFWSRVFSCTDLFNWLYFLPKYIIPSNTLYYLGIYLL